MRAAIGDTLHIHTNHVGEAEALGEILEVRGTDGAPPYLVQFRDGRTRLLYPGPDAVVETPPPAGPPAGGSNGGSSRPPRSARRIHTRPGW
jgi:hypothetical protein